MKSRILVVDDEPDLEHLIKQKFRKEIKEEKYLFQFAGNGVEAMEKLRRDTEIELVLTDINMPEMDGLTLLNEMRELNNPLLRPVIVSAYGDIDNIRTAMNRGAFDFIIKPIDLADLEITVKKSLDDLQTLKDALRSHDDLISIQKELSIASSIQTSILPKNNSELMNRSEFDIFAKMIPAKEVGGDLYDYFLLDKHRIGFIIGDVSGKGVPAAMFMAVTKTLFKATALSGATTEVCLDSVNKILVSEVQSNLFVTICYGILDTRNGALEYTCGGHHPPILISKDGNAVSLEKPNGVLLGKFKEAEYNSNLIMLKPGDSIFLYTDGITEAMNSKDEMFGDDRLIEALNSNLAGGVEKITLGVIESVESFSEGAPQFDDITCLTVHYNSDG